MIRQHFYPKSFFRHRSLSKNQYKTDPNISENADYKSPKQIQCNQIKFIKKKSPHNLQNQQQSFHLQTCNTQNQQQSSSNTKFSTKKIDPFPSSHSHTEIFENNVLRQIHNRANRQNPIQKQKLMENDIKNLFIKSDRKEIVKTSKKKYQVYEHQNNQNESFVIDNHWQNQKRKVSARKLSTADPSKCYKRSIERKKKKQKTPAQIIIQSSLSTVETKNVVQSERRKQPIFQKVTDYMINLNLSKAIKFRQTGLHDKKFRQRKTSQKISIDKIENRTYELEQKVRGWEIQVQDDIDFS